MSDRDEIAEAIATHTPELVALAPNGVDDGQHFYCIQCGVLPGATPQIATYHVADAVLAVQPSGDGPLRETLRELANDLDFLEATPPGSYPEATAYASGQEAGWQLAADKIRALLDGTS